MKFLRNLLASILGFFISIFLIFFLFIIIASLAGSKEEVVVKPNSILELDLTSIIKDYAPDEENPILEALEINDPKLALNKIFNALDNAQLDDKIKGISLNTTFVNAGFAQTQALRKKLEEFKESGKFIYAYNDVYSQKNYYLSSVADSLFLNPVGITCNCSNVNPSIKRKTSSLDFFNTLNCESIFLIILAQIYYLKTDIK